MKEMNAKPQKPHSITQNGPARYKSLQSRTKYAYARVRMARAVHVLATGEGPVKVRLIEAFRRLSPLTEADLPHRLQADFRWIRSTLTKNASKLDWEDQGDGIVWVRTGRLYETVPHLRIARAVAVTQRIWSIHTELQENGKS